MNWKKRYEKIKVGDTVKCILNPNPKSQDQYSRHHQNGHGIGWKENLVFKVKEISEFSNRILWRPNNDGGVYEDCVVKL